MATMNKEHFSVTNSDFQSLVNAGAIPFIIGVTGHMDVVDPEGCVEAALVDLFSEWGREMPDTPLLLLSSLAAGADQRVIRTAKRILGTRVQWTTILPFSRENYLNDFATPQAKETFLSLLETSLSVKQASTPEEEDTSRNEGYGRAGRCMVQSANMLIALWDGRQAAHPDGTLVRGGTWEVAHAALHGLLDGTTTLEPARTIPVIQIVTERKTPKGHVFVDGLTAAQRQPGALFLHLPVDDQAVSANALIRCCPERKQWLHAALTVKGSPFGTILRNIQAFNRSVRSAGAMHAAEIEQSIGYLGLSAFKTQSDAVMLDIQRFGLCDVLAIRKQTLYKRALNSMFLLSLITGVMGQIYSGIRMSHLFLALYLTGMSLAYLLFVVFRRCYIDRVYHDYRALAEALRVHLYWRAVGLKDDVVTFFLRKQRGELEWLRMALQNWHFLCDAAPGTSVGTVEAVQHAWVEGQVAYYRKTSKKFLHFSKRIDRVALGFYLFSILLGCFFLFLGDKVQFLERYGSFWVGLGPFVLAFIGYYQNKTAWSEHAEAYTSTGRIFAIALDRLNNTRDLHKQQELLLKLGQEALQEHSEWILVHRKRPPEPMK